MIAKQITSKALILSLLGVWTATLHACKVSVGKTKDAGSPSQQSSLIAPGVDRCPASRLGNGGCIRSKDGLALLNVEYLAPPNSGRPLVLIINGGPGLDSVGYHRIPFFQSLLPGHDVAFYTQRATGQASYTGPRESLNTSVNVEDLETVRAALRSERPDVVAMAHSYGGTVLALHLARFPGAFSKAVFLNAVPGGKILAYQASLILLRAYEIASRKHGPAKALGFLTAAIYGRLVDGQGRKFSGVDLVTSYLDAPTLATLTAKWPARFDELFALNGSVIARAMALGLTLGKLGDRILAEAARPAGQSLSLTSDEFSEPDMFALDARLQSPVNPAAGASGKQPPSAGQGPTVTTWIDCNSTTTPEVLEDFERGADRANDLVRFAIGFSRLRMKDLCGSLQLEGREVLPIKEGLSAIRTEILQVGSSDDASMPKASFGQFHDALLAAGVRASLVMVNAAGHLPIVERPECLAPHVSAFLKGTHTPGTSTECP